MTDSILWLALAILTPDGRSRPASSVAAVLSWQSTAVPATLQARVEIEVTEIWRRIGVNIEWRTPRAGELGVSVIVKDTGATAGLFPPLGWVNFVDHKPTAVLYASADAAWNTVLAGHTDTGRVADGPRHLHEMLVARLLGRAVAHELGHYLLGSGAHTSAGLMRPRLEIVDALSRSSAWYDLDRAQRRTLQARMAVLTLSARLAVPTGSRISGPQT
jgi:hypothetical protein